MSMSVASSREFIQDERKDVIECGCGRHSFAVSKLLALTVVSTVIIVGLVIAVVILAVQEASCISNSIPSNLTQPVSSSCQDPECYFDAASILNGIDENVKPCDDFYNYACGRRINQYEDSNKIVIDEFRILKQKIDLRVNRILEDNTTDDMLKSLKKAKMMYKACLNSKDEKSLAYIQDVMKSLGGMPLIEGPSWDTNKNFKQFSDLFAFYKKALSFAYVGTLFSVDVTKDTTVNVSNYIVQISPPKIKYLRAILKILSQDINNLQNIMQKFTNTSINQTDFKKDITNTKNLIQHLIDNLTSTEEQVNRTTVDDFISITNKNIWLEYLNSQFANFKQFTKENFILVENIDYFTQLPLAFSDDFQPRTIFNLEFLSFLFLLMNSLKNPFLHQNELTLFPFFPSLVSDTANEQCLLTNGWEKCGCITSKYFSHVLARKYAQVHSMVNRSELAAISSNIFKAFETRLKNVDWLSSPTKSKAMKKLEQMKKTYLYPEWVDNDATLNAYYQNIKLTEDDHLKNVISLKADHLNKLYSLIETSSEEIVFNALRLTNYLDVNAVYIRLFNSMIIFEGISQRPFYSSNIFASMNYGSLGLVIGHEITHGYDNTGIQYDGFGTQVEWMTPDDRDKFNAKAKCFEQQYSSYVMTSEDLPGASSYNVNGSKTLGENIADNGGALTAYWAYKEWIRLNGPEKLPESLRNFTSDQIFFISYAQRWCMKIWNGVTYKQALEQDEHSPNKYRIIGTLSNLKEFSEAFQCSEEEKMNRGKNSCSLW